MAFIANGNLFPYSARVSQNGCLFVNRVNSYVGLPRPCVGRKAALPLSPLSTLSRSEFVLFPYLFGDESKYASENMPERPQIPVSGTEEMAQEFAAPVLCDIFAAFVDSSMFGVYVVPDFVVKNFARK